MTVEQCPLSAVLIGEGASPEAAANYPQVMRGCRYLVTASASERLVLAAFVLPESKRQWLEAIAEEPARVGLSRIQLTFSHTLKISSPWSRGERMEAADSPLCWAGCPGCEAGLPSAEPADRPIELARHTGSRKRRRLEPIP